jgi:hypothetical protein
MKTLSRPTCAEKLEAGELPQAFLGEYRRALLAAEHTWIQTVIAGLSRGSPVWDGRMHKNAALCPAQNLAPDLDIGG